MMQDINDYSEFQNISEGEGMSLFYLSRPACGVCTALKPKVSSMLTEFPEIPSFYVNLDDIPEAAGQLSIFTIPAVLVYAGGKEVVREARYISVDDLAEKIRRPYGFLYTGA
ncbi:MAG: thioredoxin family protein [Spirochaetaceae bacterium]|nr:thioredoxin family protein [Spirochaetaceae bacterium]